MNSRSVKIELLDEEMVERMAHILGPGSAAQLALNDAKARRERGEEVVLGKHGSTIVVVPKAAFLEN